MIKMTFAELYNEEIKDLLATASQSEQQGMLKIVDDPHLGPLIQALVLFHNELAALTNYFSTLRTSRRPPSPPARK